MLTEILTSILDSANDAPGLRVLVSFCWISAISGLLVASGSFHGIWLTGFSPTSRLLLADKELHISDMHRDIIGFAGECMRVGETCIIPTPEENSSFWWME